MDTFPYEIITIIICYIEPHFLDSFKINKIISNKVSSIKKRMYTANNIHQHNKCNNDTMQFITLTECIELVFPEYITCLDITTRQPLQVFPKNLVYFKYYCIYNHQPCEYPEKLEYLETNILAKNKKHTCLKTIIYRIKHIDIYNLNDCSDLISSIISRSGHKIIFHFKYLITFTISNKIMKIDTIINRLLFVPEFIKNNNLIVYYKNTMIKHRFLTNNYFKRLSAKNENNASRVSYYNLDTIENMKLDKLEITLGDITNDLSKRINNYKFYAIDLYIDRFLKFDSINDLHKIGKNVYFFNDIS